MEGAAAYHYLTSAANWVIMEPTWTLQSDWTAIPVAAEQIQV